MIEYTVEDQAYSQLLGVFCQRLEIVLGAKHGVDSEVIAGVIAVVAQSFKYGVEVDGGDAHLVQTGKILADSLKRASVEIPILDRIIASPIVDRRGIPIPNDLLSRTLAGLFNLFYSALAPIGIAAVPIGKDLVNHALFIPSRPGCTVLVDGNLKRGDIGVVVSDRLSARCAHGRSHVAGIAILRGNYKAVPLKLGFVALN